MDEMTDSELTMVTNKVFNDVLQCVQNSCLNYQIQMSPFSAIISLKKSIIKNKAGSPIMPKLQDSNNLNRDLDIELVLMKRKYEDLLLKHTSALETIRILKDALKATGLTANNNFLVSPKTNEDLDAESEVQKKCQEEMKMQKEFHIDVENFKNKEETTI